VHVEDIDVVRPELLERGVERGAEGFLVVPGVVDSDAGVVGVGAIETVACVFAENENQSGGSRLNDTPQPEPF
jgi:hypothetical protein